MHSIARLSFTTPAARRWAPWVLGVWLLVWFLSALQPCCEAVAAMLPHAHAGDAPAAQTHPPHAPEHAGLHDDEVGAHSAPPEHCTPLDAPAQDAPAVTGGPASDVHGSDKHIAPLTGTLGPVHNFDAKSSAIRVSHRSPSCHRQYLATLRLRI